MVDNCKMVNSFIIKKGMLLRFGYIYVVGTLSLKVLGCDFLPVLLLGRLCTNQDPLGKESIHR